MSDSYAAYFRRINGYKPKPKSTYKSNSRETSLTEGLLKRKEELCNRIKLLDKSKIYLQGLKRKRLIIEEAANEKLTRWLN